MSENLAEIAELLRRHAGIALDEAQLPALAAALARVDPGADPDTFLSEVRGREATSSSLARLIDEVTNQESYFFREPRDLHAIDWFDLAERARRSGSGTVRIWVSACAAGEEAYTLAILASEAFGSGRPPVDILATDVSGAALRAAQEATYSGTRVRNLPPVLRERYFEHDGGRHRLRDGVASLVRFRRHNLVRDPAPPTGEGRFHVVTCRNVLIYFDPETVRRVISTLETGVEEDGQLILGVADRLPGTTGRLDRAPADQGPRRPAATRKSVAAERGRRPPPHPAESTIEDALRAADEGDLERAIALASTVLDRDPLDADAYFVRGLAELGRGDGGRAVESFRRALYVDPTFGLAAFKLGRAQDSCGQAAAARLAYERALRELDPKDDRHRTILDQVDLGDVAAACRARLGSGGIALR
jgi:chemotaxis protein methyltransferase CheR